VGCHPPTRSFRAGACSCGRPPSFGRPPGGAAGSSSWVLRDIQTVSSMLDGGLAWSEGSR